MFVRITMLTILLAMPSFAASSKVHCTLYEGPLHEKFAEHTFDLSSENSSWVFEGEANEGFTRSNFFVFSKTGVQPGTVKVSWSINRENSFAQTGGTFILPFEISGGLFTEKGGRTFDVACKAD